MSFPIKFRFGNKNGNTIVMALGAAILIASTSGIVTKIYLDGKSTQRVTRIKIAMEEQEKAIRRALLSQGSYAACTLPDCLGTLDLNIEALRPRAIIGATGCSIPPCGIRSNVTSDPQITKSSNDVIVELSYDGNDVSIKPYTFTVSVPEYIFTGDVLCPPTAPIFKGFNASKQKNMWRCRFLQSWRIFGVD